MKRNRRFLGRNAILKLANAILMQDEIIRLNAENAQLRRQLQASIETIRLFIGEDEPEPERIKVKCVDCKKNFSTVPEAIWDTDGKTGKSVYMCTRCIIAHEAIDEDAEEDCVWEEEG